MEDNKNASNNAIIVILLLFIICLMGYICYDKVLKKSTTDEYYFNDLTTTTKACVFRYADYVKNVGEGRAKTLYIVNNDIVPHFPINKVTLSRNGDVTVYFEDSQYIEKYGESFRISTDIIDIYVAEYGNGGLKTLIMVKNDGGLLSTTSAMYNEVTLFLNRDYLFARDVISVYSRLTDASENESAYYKVYAKGLFGEEYDITNEIK